MKRVCSRQRPWGQHSCEVGLDGHTVSFESHRAIRADVNRSSLLPAYAVHRTGSVPKPRVPAPAALLGGPGCSGRLETVRGLLREIRCRFLGFSDGLENFFQSIFPVKKKNVSIFCRKAVSSSWPFHASILSEKITFQSPLWGFALYGFKVTGPSSRCACVSVEVHPGPATPIVDRFGE